MPRKSNTRDAWGMGSIRQRGDGTWEARYTTGRDPGTGKQVQKSVYGKTQKEVSQKLKRISSALDDGSYVEHTKMSVGAWLDHWKDTYLVNVKPSTVVSYTQHIENHIRPALGAVNLSALNADQIQQFYNRLLREGMSPKTIKNVHGVLHAALKQAIKLCYIKANPTEACTLPRIEKPEISPLDRSEIETFLQAIRGHRFEALYIVDIFTGMREAEILGLQWHCVDFKNGTILVDKQLQRPRVKGGAYYLGPPKNDTARVLSPAPYIMEILKKHRLEQNRTRLLAGSLWDDHGFPDLVFTSDFGKFLCYKAVLEAFRRILRDAGLPEKRLHDLRHTYAVASLCAGDDVKTVQENLGHATAAFTLDQYAHVTETMRHDGSNRMETFIRGLDIDDQANVKGKIKGNPILKVTKNPCNR